MLPSDTASQPALRHLSLRPSRRFYLFLSTSRAAVERVPSAGLRSRQGRSGGRALPSAGAVARGRAPRPSLMRAGVSQVPARRQSASAGGFGRGRWREPPRGAVPRVRTCGSGVTRLPSTLVFVKTKRSGKSWWSQSGLESYRYGTFRIFFFFKVLFRKAVAAQRFIPRSEGDRFRDSG